MGLPVVIVPSGGLPVTEATNGFGLPVEIAANGFGIAVTIVASCGLPVIGTGGGPQPPAGAPTYYLYGF